MIHQNLLRLAEIFVKNAEILTEIFGRLLASMACTPPTPRGRFRREVSLRSCRSSSRSPAHSHSSRPRDEEEEKEAEDEEGEEDEEDA